MGRFRSVDGRVCFSSFFVLACGSYLNVSSGLRVVFHGWYRSPSLDGDIQNDCGHLDIINVIGETYDQFSMIDLLDTGFPGVANTDCELNISMFIQSELSNCMELGRHRGRISLLRCDTRHGQRGQGVAQRGSRGAPNPVNSKIPCYSFKFTFAVGQSTAAI